IGGGAAGFFAAINAAEAEPEANVAILEKSPKLLSKVKVSGGGRCNVTHHCEYNSELVKNYPRGEKELRTAFEQFSVKDIIQWFSKRGVRLKTEEDGRMFPVSDNSQTVIDCFLGEAQRLGITVKTRTEVRAVRKKESGFLLETSAGEMACDSILVATGGNAREAAYEWLSALGHTIVSPVPSLFTFNMPGNEITKLMGVSVPAAKTRIAGTRFESAGPLLITHWGMSGPAVLKLSSLAARDLFRMNYRFTLLVNWLPKYNGEKLRIELLKLREEQAGRFLHSSKPFGLPARLWEFLLSKAGIKEDMRWADLPKKQQNVLINSLVSDAYPVSGKTTFKEEFVTCGGIALKEVDFSTMESRVVPGLYFAGEVLDVDGVTGGFNFQNAWTTAWIAARSMARK
ncbi:MAG: NAD(P)/FAD-dependent oxidoreductase, partial [Bacteroidota bacterium]